jgi:flagellar motor switch protein FliN/FliY
VSEQPHRTLLETWNQCLRQAVEALAGETPEITSPEEPRAPAAAVRWWRQPLSYPAGAQIWIGTSEDVPAALGMRVLQAAGLADSSEEEAGKVYYEVLQQAASAMAASLSARFGQEVRALEGEEKDGPAPAESLELRLVLPGAEPIRLWVAFAGFEGAPAQIPPPAGQQPQPAEVARTDAMQPIDLLLDVELPVSVSFGRTHLPLKDVLKLTSGSIVELNRPVAEPVEVIVNNCVIARGEVVVVEGNYGVRITEIVSRQQRLRSLS